ncbi:hypothetical protein NDU88_007568 [Pleurodeles waltl]|uniref:Uncharacterized protein n=1 Tax=Pleurodeles waltl TaxID=8319 RepID=A0AAV7QNF8_PLEWA|nr:hypothetical protein NDU88_007568 [Pleurodeles waltl]
MSACSSVTSLRVNGLGLDTMSPSYWKPSGSMMYLTDSMLRGRILGVLHKEGKDQGSAFHRSEVRQSRDAV